MARRALLHIGTFKTGSTTIQSFLHENADALLRQGFYYPHSLGRPNQHGLALYAISDWRETGLTRHHGIADRADRAEKQKEIKAALDRELESLSGEASIVIFSNEHLAGLYSNEEITRLKDLLSAHFDEISIIVYLRRQDKRIISDYTQKVRDGYVEELDLLNYLPAEGRDYAAFLEKWEAVFGRENIHPRIFDRSKFIGGDLVHDFFTLVGGVWEGDIKSVEVANSGLSHAAIEFLRLFNKNMPQYVDGEPNPARKRLLPMLAEGFPGGGTSVARSEAMELLDLVKSSNEELGRRYFDGEAPFPDDLTSYPEMQAPALSFADAAEISAFLWRRQNETIEAAFERQSVQEQSINALKQKNDRLRLALVEDGDLARSYAERVLASDPNNSVYFPTLLDVFMLLHSELVAARKSPANSSGAERVR